MSQTTPTKDMGTPEKRKRLSSAIRMARGRLGWDPLDEDELKAMSYDEMEEAFDTLTTELEERSKAEEEMVMEGVTGPGAGEVPSAATEEGAEEPPAKAAKVGTISPGPVVPAPAPTPATGAAVTVPAPKATKLIPRPGTGGAGTSAAAAVATPPTAAEKGKGPAAVGAAGGTMIKADMGKMQEPAVSMAVLPKPSGGPTTTPAHGEAPAGQQAVKPSLDLHKRVSDMAKVMAKTLRLSKPTEDLKEEVKRKLRGFATQVGVSDDDLLAIILTLDELNAQQAK